MAATQEKNNRGMGSFGASSLLSETRTHHSCYPLPITEVLIPYVYARSAFLILILPGVTHSLDDERSGRNHFGSE